MYVHVFLILAQVTGTPALYLFCFLYCSRYARDDRISQRPTEETYGRASGHPEATHRAATAGYLVPGNLDEASCSKNRGRMWLHLSKEGAREAVALQ